MIARELDTIGKASKTEGGQQEVDVLNLLQMIVSTVDYQFA